MHLKWIKFTDKFPHLDTNILLTTDGNNIGIINWTPIVQKAWKLSLEKNQYAPCMFYTTDPDEDIEQDITIAVYWAYPTHMLSKQQRNNKNG